MQLSEVTKNKGNALRKVAQEATRGSDKAYWEQAKALHAICYSGYAIGDLEVAPLYELWGYDTWYDYVEGEVGIHVGKASRMVSVAHFFTVKMADHWNKQILSPTRMRTLSTAKVVTPKNLNTWITKARNMTPCELDHQLLGHNRATKSMGFKFAASDRDVIKEQLEFIRAEGGHANLSEALLSMFVKRRKGNAA